MSCARWISGRGGREPQQPAVVGAHCRVVRGGCGQPASSCRGAPRLLVPLVVLAVVVGLLRLIWWYTQL